MTKLHQIPGICAETRYTLWPNDMQPAMRSRVLKALDEGYLVGSQESATFQIIDALRKGLSQRFARDVAMPIHGQNWFTSRGDIDEPSTELRYPQGALFAMEDDLDELARELEVTYRLTCARRNEKPERKKFVPDSDDRYGIFHMITPNEPRMHQFVKRMLLTQSPQFKHDMRLMADIIRSGEAVDYAVTHVAKRNK